MDWLQSLILGIVQGVTEFLPVSSDGHLNVTQMLFARYAGRSRSGAENLFFDVMLHVGTMAAILIYYRGVIRDALLVFVGRRDGPTGPGAPLADAELDRDGPQKPPPLRREMVIRVGLLAVVATLPLVPYALLKKHLEAAFESPTVTGIGFLVTAAALMLTARLRGGQTGPGRMAWWQALIIGIAQAFAPLPGVSRSGLTIAAGLGLGLSRTWAVGFSLLIAVPAICGATVFEIKDLDRASLTAERVAQTVAATIVAGLVGYAAIVWLVRIVRSGRVWYFSVYLIVLAAFVLGFMARQGGRSDARSDALDRPVRGGAATAGPGGGAP